MKCEVDVVETETLRKTTSFRFLIYVSDVLFIIADMSYMISLVMSILHNVIIMTAMISFIMLFLITMSLVTYLLHNDIVSQFLDFYDINDIMNDIVIFL